MPLHSNPLHVGRQCEGLFIFRVGFIEFADGGESAHPEDNQPVIFGELWLLQVGPRLVVEDVVLEPGEWRYLPLGR